VFWLFVILGLLDIDVFDFDIDLDAGVTGVAGWLLSNGISGIPVTLIISLMILFSWVMSYFLSQIVLPLIPFEVLNGLMGLIVIILSFVISVPMTVICTKPLTGLFIKHNAQEKSDLIGKKCEIRSLTVSETFGQAIVIGNGAGLILDVKSKTPNNLKKGMQAIIITYDKNNNTFEIISEEEFIN
jgi:hypothetical protein